MHIWMRTREQKLFFFSLRETFNQKYFIKIYFNFNYSENIIDQKYIAADNQAGVGKIVQSSVCCLLVGNSLHILLQFWSRESGVGERGKQREPRISNQEIVILPTHSVCPARDLKICTPITVIRMTKIALCY